MKEVYEFLMESKTYYIATIDNDKPSVRPFGTIDIFDGKLHIQTGKRKAVSHQMKANPNIEIVSMNGHKWIRIQAKAYLNTDVNAEIHMLEKYPELKSMYQPNDGNNEVFYLTDVKATINEFGKEPIIKTF